MNDAHAQRQRGGGAHRRKRRGEAHGGHDGPDERWLLTYSDMITLLMALFIVMWSISSVNTSKFAALKASLTQAFNGHLAEGGSDIRNGAPGLLEQQQAIVGPVNPDVTSLDPKAAVTERMDGLDRQDLENLERLKRDLDSWSASHGLRRQLATEIDERGLVVRVLTDGLLFDSAQAVLRPAARPVLGKVADLLRDPARVPNAVRVEGNTDDVPIAGGRFRNNWELSAARATAVLEALIALGLAEKRLSAAAYADQRPLASNRDAAGRALNRRVELVVLRRALTGSRGGPS